MNTPSLERLKQQMAALQQYNREQRQKREREMLLRLKKLK